MATTGVAALPEVIIDTYSDMFLYTALGINRFEDFAVIRTDLTKMAGDTLIFIKFDDLTGDPLVTVDDITAITDTATMSSSTISISVNEYFKAVKLSEKLLVTSFDDVMSQAATQLARHYAVWGIDKSLKDVALFGDGAQTPSVLFANERSVRSDLVSTDIFDTALVRRAVETLQTRNAPKFGNDFYVCIAHPHQLSNLKQDPDWISANNYADTRMLFNGEVGRWEDVVFISSSNMYNGAVSDSASPAFLDLDVDTVNDLEDGEDGNQTDVYLASLFGDSYYALAWALPTELRDDGVINYGRQHALAWYGIWGAGLLLGEHGLRLETA